MMAHIEPTEQDRELFRILSRECDGAREASHDAAKWTMRAQAHESAAKRLNFFAWTAAFVSCVAALTSILYR